MKTKAIMAILLELKKEDHIAVEMVDGSIWKGTDTTLHYGTLRMKSDTVIFLAVEYITAVWPLTDK